nr:MAG TPA: hypothetical protein [Bacteriophage sp.]DAF14533.1 MAG TPA: hypothetical protein [Crassvirales sp.]
MATLFLLSIINCLNLLAFPIDSLAYFKKVRIHSSLLAIIAVFISLADCLANSSKNISPIPNLSTVYIPKVAPAAKDAASLAEAPLSKAD